MLICPRRPSRSSLYRRPRMETANDLGRKPGYGLRKRKKIFSFLWTVIQGSINRNRFAKSSTPCRQNSARLTLPPLVTLHSPVLGLFHRCGLLLGPMGLHLAHAHNSVLDPCRRCIGQSPSRNRPGFLPERPSRILRSFWPYPMTSRRPRLGCHPEREQCRPRRTLERQPVLIDSIFSM